MPKSSGYDIIAVLTHLIKMLDPVARSQDLRLAFKNKPQKLYVDQDTAGLMTGLTDLLYKIIKYTPANNDIWVTLAEKKENGGSFLKISIVNTGTNLSKVTEVNNHLQFTVTQSRAEKGGTSFETHFRIEQEDSGGDEPTFDGPVKVPAFYAEIRKRFVLHYSKAEHLVAALSNFNPRDAAFLKKVNALIAENISNPEMDTNYISNALHMSRTQLFRRLKPIIRQSPGCYIKAQRLQKAKELFETTDLRVSEVAFKTGFESPSHFAKSFIGHFGVKPSLFCRNKKMQQMSK